MLVRVEFFIYLYYYCYLGLPYRSRWSYCRRSPYSHKSNPKTHNFLLPRTHGKRKEKGILRPQIMIVFGSWESLVLYLTEYVIGNGFVETVIIIVYFFVFVIFGNQTWVVISFCVSFFIFQMWASRLCIATFFLINNWVKYTIGP